MEVLFVTFEQNIAKITENVYIPLKSGLISSNAYDSCHLYALSMEGQPVQPDSGILCMDNDNGDRSHYVLRFDDENIIRVWTARSMH